MVKGKRSKASPEKVKSGDERISRQKAVAKQSKQDKDMPKEQTPVKLRRGRSKEQKKMDGKDVNPTAKTVFGEGDNIVEMEVRGQHTEFQSDNETETNMDIEDKVEDTEEESEQDNEGMSGQSENSSSGEDENMQSEDDSQKLKSDTHSTTTDNDVSSGTSPRRCKRCKHRRRLWNKQRRSRSESISNSESSSRSRSRSRTRSKSNERKKKYSRRDLEKKLDQVNDTLMVVQNCMIKKGIFEEMETDDHSPSKTRSPKYNDKNRAKSGAGKTVIDLSRSETTIYRDALIPIPDDSTPEDQNSIIEPNIQDNPDTEEMETESIDPDITFNIKKPVKQTRESTSSEDKMIDTSDEMLELDCDKFIADCREEAERRSAEHPSQHAPPPKEQRKEYPGERLIRETEMGRVRMYKSTGKEFHNSNQMEVECLQLEQGGNPASLARLGHTSAMDEEYLVIGSHIDSALQQKIINFEYIDFAKLIPKDRITKMEDQRFELIVKGGLPISVPFQTEKFLVLRHSQSGSKHLEFIQIS